MSGLRIQDEDHGVYPAMSRAAYDGLVRVNWSTLKEMGRSPAHYRHRLLTPRDDSDAMKLGRCVHLAVFEPERFGAEVIRWGGGRRAGKEWQTFCEANANREILTESEWETCQAIQASVRSGAASRPLLEGGPAEVSVLWRHEAEAIGGLDGYSVDCKGRLDFLGKHALVDLKTCRDASPEAFGRAAWNMGYLGQAAFYSDGYRAATGKELPFVFVAVENAAPYAVAVYHIADEHLELGRNQYRSLLDGLNVCRRESRWLDYGEMPLQLPRWAAPRGEDDDAADLDLQIGA